MSSNNVIFKSWLIVPTLVGAMAWAKPNLEFSDLMQAVYRAQATEAELQYIRQYPQLQDDWLFLAALVAGDDGHFEQAYSLLQQYLQLGRDNVYRLRARAAFNALRQYRQQAGFAEYWQILRLRDRHDTKQLQWHSQRFREQNYHPRLIAKVSLLQAHSLLEMANQPDRALVLYQTLAQTLTLVTDRYTASLGEIYCLHRMGQLRAAQQRLTQLQQQVEEGMLSNHSLLTRAWTLRLEATATLLTQPSNNIYPAPPLLWGIGPRLDLDNPVGSGQDYRPLWAQPPLADITAQTATLWITRHSDWRWLHSALLRMSSQEGYTPMISLWYFGDEISPEFVKQQWPAYLKMIHQQLIPLLSQVPTAYLLLEPEFNKNGIERWPEWDQRMLEVIALIRAKLPHVQLGLVLGDWDPTGTRSFNSARESIQASDFIGTMLMVANYTESAHTDPDWSPWIRTLRLGQQLQQQFNKPWMIAYVAIASEPSWQQRQQIELAKLSHYLTQMRQYGLFALNWFSVVDEPNQTGWFADAETSFGLFDQQYQPKPVFQQWQQLANATPNAGQLLAWDVLSNENEARIEAQFSHWSSWQLTIWHQKKLLWHQQGVGEQLHVVWANYTRFQGDLIVQLQANEQIYWQPLSLENALPMRAQREGSRSWLQQWQPIKLLLLADYQFIRIRLDPNQLLDDHWYVGQIDQRGAMRMVRAQAYAYQTEQGINIEFPLTALPTQWRKYESNGSPIWLDDSFGDIQLAMMHGDKQMRELAIAHIELY
ncbi:MAG: hypothetical protein R3Y10_04435 [Ferrimonas sp.]